MNKYIKIIGILLVIICIYALVQKNSFSTDKDVTVKVGVITALTGDVAYWGQSTLLGAELAKMDLAKEGINADFIFDDAQLDPNMALNAAQKEVNIDKVDAIYSEFNPAAIAVTSYLKDKDILHVYDAAPVSPLKENQNTYKTFTDFQLGCQNIAAYLKNKGITKVGVLENNLEFGQLCLTGIKNVYGDNISVETFNPGIDDFRTMLAKLKQDNVQAIFNASFSTDQIVTLKNMKDLNMNLPFVGTTDIVTPEVVKQNANLFSKTIIFGLPVVSQDFINRLKETFPGKTITNEQAAGLAYIHLKQMAEVLHSCGKDMSCIRNGMDNEKPESIVGFNGFKDHIANFDVLIQQWQNGQFVNI